MEDIASEAAITCLNLYREIDRKTLDTLPQAVRDCWNVGEEAEKLIRQEIYRDL